MQVEGSGGEKEYQNIGGLIGCLVNAHVATLNELKTIYNLEDAMDMYEAIQRADFRQMGILVRKTWQQNQSIDSGTNPEEVEAITRQIDDFCLGYKLGGAGLSPFLCCHKACSGYFFR